MSQPLTRSHKNERPIITNSNPKSPISEAYRALRTNIEFSSIDTSVKVMMLTSAGPGEGKSTTVANLAVVYAQSHKHVLVIDADLRKPTMHHTFAKSNR
jgi:Mrp family chromosome partitioning ATPase